MCVTACYTTEKRNKKTNKIIVGRDLPTVTTNQLISNSPSTTNQTTNHQQATLLNESADQLDQPLLRSA